MTNEEFLKLPGPEREVISKLFVRLDHDTRWILAPHGRELFLSVLILSGSVDYSVSFYEKDTSDRIRDACRIRRQHLAERTR